MVLFLYGNNEFQLSDFAEFVETRSEFFKPQERPTQFGVIPNIDRNMLLNFFDETYPDTEKRFKSINLKLVDYYMAFWMGSSLLQKLLSNSMNIKNRKRNLH